MNDVRHAIVTSLADSSFGDRFFKRLRLQLLKPEQFVGFLPHEGVIYDLGCGFGLCSVAAAFNSRAMVIACDIDQERIAVNRQAFAGFKNLRFEVADFFSFAPDQQADAIMLIDSLHYFPVAKQEELLRHLWMRIRPGGRLIIRDPVRDSSLRFRWNQLHEKVLVEITSWTKTKSGKSWFLTMGQWLQIFDDLEDAILVKNFSCHKYLPYNDRLFVLERRT